MFTKKTIKRLLLVVGFLAVLVAIGIAYITWLMSQPLYTFGSVRTGENLRGPLKPPEQTDKEHWQVESDISLTFDAYGEGHPVLVVHGGPGIPYADSWKGLASLTDRFRFYYYHQRGCGNSTRPFDRFDGDYYENMTELERTLGLGAQIADIERIRQILGREKITLIGHSFGGFIAALYAAEFPHRVDKLILVAPAGILTPPDEDRDLFAATRAKLDKERRAKFDSVLEEYFDFGNIFSKSDAELVDVHQRIGQFILAAMAYDPSEVKVGPRSGGWAVFASYFSIGKSQDYRPALLEIQAPTLILHGEDDNISLPGSRTYEAIPDSTFVTLQREEEGRRAGHFVFDDSPNAFGSAVEGFLSSR